MHGNERIEMSRRDLKRLDIAQRVASKEMTQGDGARLLGISTRQMRRITGRIELEGSRGVLHRGRNAVSNHRFDAAKKRLILDVMRTKYVEFGPTLAAEKLMERDGIRVSRETVRKWLIEDGLEYRRRRRKGHRVWRERKGHFGEMVQLDGSHHDWFEGRGEKCVLMAYVDDATSEVFARFYEYEGTVPAMDSFLRSAALYGLPASVYLDRHSTYKGHPGKARLDEELAGTEALSQFERALGELAVEVIHANSPQAKGRVERTFETFQDRVLKEMRLEGVSGLKEGNEFLERYLPNFNARFRKMPREQGDLHRKRPTHQEMMKVLSCREERSVRKDSTVQYGGRVMLLKDRTWATKVLVEERLDGRMVIRDRNRTLAYEDITEKARPAKNPAAAPLGGVRIRQGRLTFG